MAKYKQKAQSKKAIKLTLLYTAHLTPRHYLHYIFTGFEKQRNEEIIIF